MFSGAFSGDDDDVVSTRTLEIIKSPPFPCARHIYTFTIRGTCFQAHNALGARPLVARHAKLIPLIIF